VPPLSARSGWSLIIISIRSRSGVMGPIGYPTIVSGLSARND
jgi:hypothetical protein